jgi:hypothetical protein
MLNLASTSYQRNHGIKKSKMNIYNLAIKENKSVIHKLNQGLDSTIHVIEH